MNGKNVYRLVCVIIGSVVGILGGVSIADGKFLVGAFILILGISGVSVFKKKFLGRYIDERDYRISEKSARRTVQITGLVLGLSAVLLLGLSNSDLGNYTQAANALAYGTCFLLLTKLFTFSYYRRKKT